MFQTTRTACLFGLLVAKSNAGLPELTADGIVYSGTPAVMAAYAVKAYDAGARVLGACCGSTPEHIRAMAQALEKHIDQ